MLKLFLISIDMLVSLPLIMLIVMSLIALTYMTSLNNSYISLFSHELYSYARSQIIVEFGNAKASNTIPLNEDCGGCRIITCNGIAYKMVVN